MLKNEANAYEMCDQCVMLDIGHGHLERRLRRKNQQKTRKSFEKQSKCVRMCYTCVMFDIGHATRPV